MRISVWFYILQIIYTNKKVQETDKGSQLGKPVLLNKKKNYSLEKWRCGGSNPVPLACKASALPFELHPHLLVLLSKLLLTLKANGAISTNYSAWRKRTNLRCMDKLKESQNKK